MKKCKIFIFIKIRLFGIQLSMAMGVKNLVIAFFHKCFAIVLTKSQDRTECQSVRYLKQSSTQLLQSFLHSESETDPRFYSLHFMEPEGSSPLLKKSDVCPYSEPHQSMTISIFLKIRFNNILPSKPGSFSQISSPKPHVPPLLYPIRATRSSHLILI